MSDHAVNKVAQAIIRLIAFALIVVSFLFYALDILAYMQHKPFSGFALLALKSIPMLAGVVLAFASRPLAARLTKDLD